VSGAVIHVSDVSRSFGAVVALNSVTFDVNQGVTGLLGPNGAGKSTLLRILTGELRPGLGLARVCGMQPFANPELYRRIGICPEQDALIDDLTGREFIALFLKLRGFEPEDAERRAVEWMERMGLEDAMNRRIRGYSKGMRQRTKLGFAFAHDAGVLFLDEPLTGLDPLWRHRIQNIVRDAAERGATVLFSSHVLHEVEQVTRDVVLLHRGRVAAQGNAREIRTMIDRFPHRVHIDAGAPRKLATHLVAWDCVEGVVVRTNGVDVSTPRPDVFYAALTQACAEDDLGVTGMSSPDDSLKALFDTLVAARPTRGLDTRRGGSAA